MATNSDLLNLAESHVGEDGTTFWDWYFGGGYVNGGTTPWCACFVSWCLDQLGVSCAGIPSSYVPAIQTAAADAGKALSPTDAIEGDVIIFDWNKNGVGDHIGFCVENHDGWMDTVEGNVSNSVGRRTRYWSNVLMAIRPDYDGQAAAPTTDGNVGSLDGETGASTTTTSTTDTMEDTMQFICNYNGQGQMVWYDGSRLHWLDEPDTMTSVQMAYKAATGRDIPVFDFGSADAPWASRFAEAVYDGSDELSKFEADHK